MLGRLLGVWEAVAPEPQERFDWRVPGALVMCALVLVFEEYAGDRDVFSSLFAQHALHPDYELWSYLWWAGSKLVGYGVVPLLALRIARVPWQEAYLGLGDLRAHLAMYGALYVCVAPVLVLASLSPSFLATYPFYRQTTRSVGDLVGWELAYASTFVVLEVFFRGVLLGLLRRSLGSYAVFVVVVPYCMIHFGKPVLETLAAIGAGIVLGTLAMRSRSIWGGVLVHIGVAWTMDALALLRG